MAKPNPTPIPNPSPGSRIPHAGRPGKSWLICGGSGDCEAVGDPILDTIGCMTDEQCEHNPDYPDLDCGCQIFRAKRTPPGKWEDFPTKELKEWDPRQYYYWCFCARIVDTPS